MTTDHSPSSSNEDMFIHEIQLGENLIVEFKECPFSNAVLNQGKEDNFKRLVIACVALANTKGGHLFLGVSNNGSIKGIEHDLDIFKLIFRMNQHIKPIMDIDVREILIQDKRVVVLIIRNGLKDSKLYSAYGCVYKRRLLGNRNPENYYIEPEEIYVLASLIKKTDMFGTLLHSLDYGCLQESEREKMRGLISQHPGSPSYLLSCSTERFDENLHLAAPEEGKMVPTLAGVLCLGTKQMLNKYVPTSGILFRVMDGTSIVYKKEYQDTLPTMVTEFQEDFRKFNPSYEFSMDLISAPIDRYDMRVFREAFINAIIHRNYLVSGPVTVILNNKELIFTSPGSFVEGVGLHNILTTGARPRYPILADISEKLNLCERVGRGIDIMYELMLKAGRPVPDYSSSNDFEVVVKISGEEPDTKFLEFINREETTKQKRFDHNSLLILTYLRKASHVSIEQLAELTASDLTSTRKLLHDLMDAGLITKYGRVGTYSLSTGICSLIGKGVESARRQVYNEHENNELILNFLKSEGKITRRDVIELCKTDTNKAYRILKRLSEEGCIVITGQKRSAYYTLRK